jgi:hypothetical protein
MDRGININLPPEFLAAAKSVRVTADKWADVADVVTSQSYLVPVAIGVAAAVVLFLVLRALGGK